ncbi:hypothetical protein CI109_106679 [Kwoniella shandongensis]|uniref:Palmitoyltransferase n=1 Tax=Kwoniella shandongensis TaxID=1734106 RepID=A0AAJ8LNV8_9TREE
MTAEYTSMERGEKKRRRSSLDIFLSRLPLYFSYILLGSTWLLFTLLITLGEILIRRREIGRFVEQLIVYNGLLFMTVVSLITTASREPMKPDQSLAPPVRLSQAQSLPGVYPNSSKIVPPPSSQRDSKNDDTNHDDDDVPLRYLKNAQWVTSRATKDRPSPLPLSTNRSGRKPRPSSPNPDFRSDSSSSSPCSESDYSPFPLSASPLVPNTAFDAGEDSDDVDDGTEVAADNASVPLLTPNEGGQSLMAKSNTGGVRWCKKCEGWKPERCHHCRHCGQCVLKMDHHCPWVGTCVGYHNYKPFLLFVSYATLLSIYVMLEAGYECIRFFRDPDGAIAHTASQQQLSIGEADQTQRAGAWANEVGLAPAVFMMLTVMGFFMTLAVGSLAGFHWYLACNNQTTLENITHSYPSVLLDIPPSPTNGHDTLQWKPDHMLTRWERQRLRHEARDINVYDLGWRRNLKTIFVANADSDERLGMRRFLRAVWPLEGRKSDRLDRPAGHFFEYDATKLEKLKILTIELRYGVKSTRGDRQSLSEDGNVTECEDDDGGIDGEDRGYEVEKAEESRQGKDRVNWFEVV